MTCQGHTHVYNRNTDQWDTLPWTPGEFEHRLVEVERPGANVPKEGTPEFEALVAELKAFVRRERNRA